MKEGRVGITVISCIDGGVWLPCALGLASSCGCRSWRCRSVCAVARVRRRTWVRQTFRSDISWTPSQRSCTAPPVKTTTIADVIICATPGVCDHNQPQRCKVELNIVKTHQHWFDRRHQNSSNVEVNWRVRVSFFQLHHAIDDVTEVVWGLKRFVSFCVERVKSIKWIKQYNIIILSISKTWDEIVHVFGSCVYPEIVFNETNNHAQVVWRAPATTVHLVHKHELLEGKNLLVCGVTSLQTWRTTRILVRLWCIATNRSRTRLPAFSQE